MARQNQTQVTTDAETEAKNEEKAKDEATTSSDDSQESSEPKVSRERIISDYASRLGHPSFVVAGALSKLEGDGDVTVAEAETAVKDFLKAETQTTSASEADEKEA